MNLFQTDFKLMDPTSDSVYGRVFSDSSIMRSFDWISGLSDALLLKIDSKKLLELQSSAFNNKLDWSIVLSGYNVSSKIKPVWIESDRVGWMIWPSRFVLDANGASFHVDRIMVCQFNFDTSIQGIPIVAYVDRSCLTGRPDSFSGHADIRSVVRFLVPKVISKMFEAEARENNESVETVKLFVKKTASEHAGSFMLGLYLGFSYFTAAEKNAAYFV
jgi:hypothetical protein